MVIYRQLARLPTCSIKIDLFVSEISSVSSCEEQKNLHCLFMSLLIIALQERRKTRNTGKLTMLMINGCVCVRHENVYRFTQSSPAARGLHTIRLMCAEASAFCLSQDHLNPSDGRC